MLYVGHFSLPPKTAVEINRYSLTRHRDHIVYTYPVEGHPHTYVVAVYSDGYFRATGPDILYMFDMVDAIANALGTDVDEAKCYAL